MPKNVSSRRSLDVAIVKSVAWTGIGNWLTQGLTWVSTLLVVRILTPDDYGLVELATVYLGFAALATEFGLGTAVVTIRNLSDEQIPQVNTVALMFAILGVGITFLLAGVVGQFFASPRVTIVLRVMSVTLLATAFGTISHAQLQKQLQFRFLAKAQITQALTAAATTLVMAILGAGYWALAAGPIVGQAVLSGIVVARAPCGYAWPMWRSLRSVFEFCRHQIVERLAWYGFAGSDRLVIGKLIGEVPLGLYSVASALGMVAVEKVTVLMLRVAPAVFSAVQSDPAALRRYLLLMTEGVAIVTFPISIGCVLVAEDAVLLLVGEQWQGAIVPLQILGLFATFQSVAALLNRVLVVVDDVRFTKHIALLGLVVMPPAFVAGTRWGLPGVAAAWLVVFPFTQLLAYYRLHQRIQLTAGGYLRALWPATSGVLFMAASVLVLRQWPAFEALPRSTNLVLTVAAGALAYSGVMIFLHWGRFREFRGLMADIGAKSAPPTQGVSG